MAENESNAVEVTMEDGRVLTFRGRQKLQKTSWKDDAGNYMLRVDFINGKTIETCLNPSLHDRFLLHGAEQKFGDECAGIKDPDDMVLAIEELAARIAAGEWSMKREGGSALAGTSVLAKALVELTGKSPEDIKAFLSDKSQAQKVALRNSSKVRPIVDRIEAAKAQKGSKVDTDALLDELEGPTEEV